MPVLPRDEEVIEFKLGGIKRTPMEHEWDDDMGDAIRKDWEKDGWQDSYCCGVRENGEATRKALNDIINWEDGAKATPNKVLIHWYGWGCPPKRTVLRFLHRPPYTYVASAMKYVTLGAIVGTGIEIAAKKIKALKRRNEKLRAKVHKKAFHAEVEAPVTEQAARVEVVAQQALQ